MPASPPVPWPATPPSPTQDAGRGAPRRADRFRPDIEGLRGLAILMVVMFHAVPGLLGGGYIGVDVFFVISGFLITGLLVRELERTGRVDLANFYVRRVRRLLPAATLAIGVTFLLSALIVPPLDLPRVAGDGVSAALSVSNIRFALAAGDYFSAVATPSPFLHYWSLSVEEQFYLVWPALLLIAFRVGRGAGMVAVTVSAVAVISLALAVMLTDAAANWAFYSLPARAWQLALGGLLAITAIGSRRSARLSRLLALVGWLGIGAVLVAGVALDASLGYPGYWALLPTLGAAAIIAGGDRVGGPGVLLGTTPLRFLGRISYALYLWHWPLLVLPAIAYGERLPLVMRIGLVVLAVVIATASTLFVEEPIRRSPTRASGRRQLAVVGTLGMALLVSVTFGLGAITLVTDAAIAESRRGGTASSESSELAGADGGPATTRDHAATEDIIDATVEMGSELDVDDSPGPSRRPTTPPANSPVADPLGRSPPPAAASIGPLSPIPDSSAPSRVDQPGLSPTPRAPKRPKPKPKPKPTPRKPVIRLPANVRPSVWDAPEDEELLRRNGCLQGEEATTPRKCVFGDRSSTFVVALVGDSHASHWFPALNKVANVHDWRLVTFVKVSCPFTDIPVRNLQLKRAYRECARFNDNTVAALRRIKPDLVITALMRWQYPTRSSDESARAQGAGIARMLNRVPGNKVIIADVPFPSHDVPACLSKNLRDVRRCAVAAYRRTSGGSPARERIAAKRSSGAFIDFGRVICGRASGCPVVSNGMIVFRDTHHLTATYSRWLASAMDRALTKILRRRS